MRIKVGPNSRELVQMMRTKDARIAGQELEIVHYNCNEQIQHEKRAQKNKRYKVGNRHDATALFVRT